MAKSRAKPIPSDPAKGNFVSQWFGHRVFPVVSAGPTQLSDQQAGRCPFLSRAAAEPRQCIKPPSSLGICTISSLSNGPRQDWLVCPYRALEQGLLNAVVQRLYGLPSQKPVLIVPAPSLAADGVRKKVVAAVRNSGSAFVFFESKLGGELSVPATDRSPELAFDFTLVPVLVFDIETLSKVSPAPLVITKIIATSAEALSHYALQIAPRHAVAGFGNADAFVNTIRRRLRSWWPELAEAELVR